MIEAASSVLAVWNDVDPAHEDEFNEWYQRQHMLERLAVRGFLDARRYVVLHGHPKYAAFYDIQDAGVFSSAAYLERLANPTEWTRRIMSWFRNMTRSACTIAASSGRGIGAFVGCVWLAGNDGSDFGKDVADAIFPHLLADPRIVRAQLWLADRTLSQVNTVEAGLRGGPDAVAERVVVIDGINEEAVARACRTVVEQAGTKATFAIYRLLCRLA